jgi:hypothetical protein
MKVKLKNLNEFQFARTQGNAVHPDSYRDREHFSFIEDYLEDPEGTEELKLGNKKTIDMFTLQPQQ